MAEEEEKVSIIIQPVMMLGKSRGPGHHVRLNCYVLETVLTDPDSPQSDMDQLFLLPDRVLGMDSLSFREDVAAVAPDFLSSVHLKNSPPHNSLDSTDSNRSSVRVLEDTEGLVFARASNGCLWLCKSGFPSKESRSSLGLE